MISLILSLTLLAGSASIESAISTGGSGWVGYSVPQIEGNARICCWDYSSGGCALERERGVSINRDETAGSIPRKLLVFAHFRDHRVDSIRIFSSDCTVDSAAANVRWLGDVATGESMEFLSGLAAKDSDRISKEAIGAIAFHEGERPLRELIRIAKHDSDSEKRAGALFWLAQSAGRRAAGTLNDVIENDPDTRVKVKAVFAIAQLPHDESVPILIRLTKTHKNSEVRRKAMFWLGQTGDPRAVAFIEDLLLK